MAFRLIFAAVVCSFAVAAPSSAQSAKCVVMQKTLLPQGEELKAKKATRDALAEDVELLGEAWENQEATRSFGTIEAKKSDDALAAYSVKKEELMMLDQGLQALIAQYNHSIAEFNRSCASD